MANMSSLENKVRARAVSLVVQATGLTLQQKRGDAPYRTGELRRSGRVLPLRSQGNVYSSGIEFTADHAAMLDRGTPPHIIRAKGGGLLGFYNEKAGKIIGVTEVHHPGSKKHKGWFSRGLAVVWRNNLRRVR